METYKLIVTLRKRGDKDSPATEDEAIAIVRQLLLEGDTIDLISIKPKAEDELRWG